MDKIPSMNTKLLALKEYVSLSEVKGILGYELKDLVTTRDVYRLVMDGKITVSAKFHHMIDARLGRCMQRDDEKLSNDVQSFMLLDGSRLDFDGKVERVHGLWDLTLLGREATDLHNYFKSDVDEVPGFVSSINAVVLKQGEIFILLQGQSQRLHHIRAVVNGLDSPPMHDDYSDCRSLDYYAHELVVKTSELLRLLQRLKPSSVEADKALTTKERTTYLLLIKALLKHNKIDPLERGVTPAIRMITETAGEPVSENTIRSILNQIRERDN